MRVRFAGFGGQGVVLCGFILGKAAMYDGKNSIHTQSYGSASRGALTKSDVQIAEGEIHDLICEELDVLVVLSQQSYGEYRSELLPEGLLFYESDLVSVEPSDAEAGHGAGVNRQITLAQLLHLPGEANEVALGPFLEIRRVSFVAGSALIPSLDPLSLAALPLIEGFVHDEKPHRVTEIQQIGRGWIVAHPDGIASQFLEDLQPPFPDLNRHGRAQCARVVVNAQTLDLHAYTVEREPFVRVKVEAPNAERSPVVIHDLVVGLDLGVEPVEIRMVR